VRGTAYWLDEYAASHRNPINKALHWVCVPLIVWSLIGLLWSLPAPGRGELDYANWASYAVAAAVLYYAALSEPALAGAAMGRVGGGFRPGLGRAIHWSRHRGDTPPGSSGERYGCLTREAILSPSRLKCLTFQV